MARSSVGRFPRGLLTFTLLFAASGMTQALPGKALSLAAATSPGPEIATASEVSAVLVSRGARFDVRLELLGTYKAEGRFEANKDGVRPQGGRGNENRGQQVRREGMRPAEVPPGLKLQPIERVVEDVPGSCHARKALRGQSHLSGFLNAMVTLAYGNEQPLLAPQHVVTDSRGRLIVADPRIPGVHVLDGKQSFRIVGGKDRRLQNPQGVAVDAEDNIYVADSEQGLVLVYDSLGRFLRSIGGIDDKETMLHRPAGIAIDREQQRLYVVDTLRERVFVFALTGRPLDRIGAHAWGEQSVAFDDPTEIAADRGELVVLDRNASRVQVVSGDGRLLRAFTVSAEDPEHRVERGLAMDAAHHIFVSNLHGWGVNAYTREGRQLPLLPNMGGTPRFGSPEGVWIDGDRFYVADRENHEVQVFRMRGN